MKCLDGLYVFERRNSHIKKRTIWGHSSMLVIKRHMLNPYQNEPNINMVAVAMGLATLSIRFGYPQYQERIYTP